MTTRPPVHRSRIKKGVIAPLAVLATTLACVAVGLPAAQATDGPKAVFGTWEWSRFTDANTDPDQPADPDGQTGEENAANVIQIGERYERQVPGTEHESSDWVRHAPPGDGWVQLPGADGEKWVQDKAAWAETVVDQAASTETVEEEAAHWQRYSWTGGPIEEGRTPSFPSADWQPNVEGDPHGVGHAGAYDRSNGSSGKADWFYLEWVPAVTRTIEHPATSHVVHHAAVAHQEFRYQRLAPAHTEYYWSVYERTNTQAAQGVEEPTDPTDPTDPADPSDATDPVHLADPGRPVSDDGAVRADRAQRGITAELAERWQRVIEGKQVEPAEQAWHRLASRARLDRRGALT